LFLPYVLQIFLNTTKFGSRYSLMTPVATGMIADVYF